MNNKLIIIGAMMCAMAITSPAFASEVTGTLSTDASKTTVGSMPAAAAGQNETQPAQVAVVSSPQSGATTAGSVPWDLPAIAKLGLVALLLVELLAVILLPRRTKVVQTS